MTDQYADTLYIEDVEEGDTAPEIVSDELTRPDFVRYAGASGDFNPIHYSEPYAKGAGFDSVFAQGMFTAGFLSHMVSDWVGLEHIDLYRTRFVAQVWPGDVISTGGRITEVDAATGHIRASVWVENQDETHVIDGSVEATLPSRSE